jgi:hypothetical protein
MKKLHAINGITFTIYLLAIVLFLSACANKEIVTECLKGHTFGFWGGLWHGIIAPIDLILMLWKNDIPVFAPNNNGAWYALGFIIGIGGWGFLGGNRATKTSKKKMTWPYKFRLFKP